MALKVGAARVCITPPAEIFPVEHFRNTMLGGKPSIFSGKIREDIFVRAFVVENNDTRNVFVCVDLPGTPEVDENMDIIAECAGVDKDHILYTCTHNHSGVYADNEEFERWYGEEFGRKMRIYRAALREQIRQVVTEAVEGMRPAKMGVFKGKSYLNVNRNESKYGAPGSTYGYNNGGPTDRDLYILKFEDLEGKTIGVMYNFAVHACMMIHNYPDGIGTEISGDFTGAACRKVEKRYDDEAVVMFTSGCAGDMNPIMMARINMIDDEGHVTTKDLGEGGPVLLEFMGHRFAQDIEAAIAQTECTITDARVWAEKKTFSAPSNKLFIYRNEQWGPVRDIEFTIGLFMLGDLAVVSTNGEVFNEIGRRVKEASPFKDTFMVTHCGHHCGYMKDDSGNGVYELSLQKTLREMYDEYRA